jgi:hypothetical protein
MNGRQATLSWIPSSEDSMLAPVSSSQNGNDPCSKVHFSMSAIRLGTAVCQLLTSGGGINISHLEQSVLCVSVSRSLL